MRRKKTNLRDRSITASTALVHGVTWLNAQARPGEFSAKMPLVNLVLLLR